jgi:hypothetical protein
MSSAACLTHGHRVFAPEYETGRSMERGVWEENTSRRVFSS